MEMDKTLGLKAIYKTSFNQFSDQLVFPIFCVVFCVVFPEFQQWVSAV